MVIFMEKIIKRTSKKKDLPKEFCSELFIRRIGKWLFGGLLALIPILYSFFKLNEPEELTLLKFFSDKDIIYVYVTMTVVLLTDYDIKRDSMWYMINFLPIMAGTMLYGALKSGEKIPLFNNEIYFSVFNISFFLFVLASGVINFKNISFE